MEKVSRRSAMKAATAGAVAVGTGVLGNTAAGDEPKATQLWTLEGELKVHPKFIYRYYIVLLDGQKCALFGSDHGREPDHLARVQLPDFVRVRGVLGTDQLDTHREPIGAQSGAHRGRRRSGHVEGIGEPDPVGVHHAVDHPGAVEAARGRQCGTGGGDE